MPNSTTLKEKIERIREFFKDPARPTWQKVGLVMVIFLLLCYPLVKRSSRQPVLPDYQAASSEAFPEGPAGLADSNAEVDSLRALHKEVTETDSRSEAATLVGTTDSQTTENKHEQNVEEHGKREEKQLVKKSLNPRIQIGPFKQVPENIPRPISVLTDADSKLWVAHRYGLLQISEDNPQEVKVILDREIYDQEFNDDLKPINAFSLIPDGGIWLGLISGELLNYERYEWTALVKPFHSSNTRITSIVKQDDEVFIAGRGLFKWNTKYKKLLTHPGFKGKALYTFVRSKDGELFVAGKSGLWKYNKDGRNWESIWKTNANDRAIYTAAPDNEGSLLLGTANGLARVSTKGILLERLLPTITVTEVLPTVGDELWVGTLKDGLKYFDGEIWYSAGTKQGFFARISALHLDRKERLWCGVDGKGLFYAPLADVRDWITGLVREAVPEAKVRVFGNACEAGTELLRGAAVTGDIALDILDGSGVVFIQGRQVCPKGLGYRRVDGSSVLVRDWRASMFIQGARSELAIPKEIPVDKVKEVFLDSQSRLWLGTTEDGVYMLQGDNWQHYGHEQQLIGNPITSFLEDRAGNLWIGTTPRYLESEKRFCCPNLHLLNDKGWFHYSPLNNLSYFGTNCLAELSNGTLVVGSRAGLSLIDKQGQVTNYGPDQGLPERFVYTMAVDRQDNIWLAHQYFGDGLLFFDAKSYQRITEKEGLFSNKISLIGVDRSRRIWLVAPNDSVGVYPRSFFRDKWQKTPVIEKKVRSLSMFQ